MKMPEQYLREAVEGLEIKSVLDVGTGHSGVYDYWWWESKPLEFKVCLDIKLIREDVKWQKIIADARRLPFRDNSFDHIQSTETLEHIPPKDHRKVLREFKRVAKKTVFVTSSGWGQHKPSPEEEALEKINPFARYQGMATKDLLEQEGFKILYYREKRHVKAVYYKK